MTGQNITNALEQLEKGKVWPVYYLYGSEPLKVDEFIERARALLFGEKARRDFEDRLDGAQVTGAEVLDTLLSVGLFGSGRRLVLVRNAQSIKKPEPLHEYLQKQNTTESVLILISETLDLRRKFSQWIKKNGYGVEMNPPRDQEAVTWAHYLAKKKNVTLDAQAAQLLAIYCQGSLYRLAAEIEKSALYAQSQDSDKILVDHVARVSAGQGSLEMIELVKAILERKRVRALVLIERLVRGSDDALGLVGFLTWFLNQGPQSPTQAQVSKSIVPGLVELDERLKTSGLDPKVLIESFVIEHSGNN